MSERTRTTRRGGILFEVLLSIAIFAGAASFVLGAMRTALDAQQRSLSEQQAVDLAASLMAEVEIGSLTLTELREGLPRNLGSFEGFSEAIDERLAKGLTGWDVSINTERTEYTGLTLVELTVFQTSPGDTRAASPDESAVGYTLRQLVALREEEAEQYEPDAMLEGLPAAAEGVP